MEEPVSDIRLYDRVAAPDYVGTPVASHVQGRGGCLYDIVPANCHYTWSPSIHARCSYVDEMGSITMDIPHVSSNGVLRS